MLKDVGRKRRHEGSRNPGRLGKVPGTKKAPSVKSFGGKRSPAAKKGPHTNHPAAFFKKATATKSPARKKTPDTKAPTPKRTPGKVAAKKVVPKRAAAPKKAATPNRATATPKAGALPPQGCYQADERREVNLQLVLLWPKLIVPLYHSQMAFSRHFVLW
ncbi:hypothetical protein DFP72DRAFT_234029 [Ephemerocybe angulata]|uniref:Uncharacterized protein n=1 Tax=Ephemerocybe angulata TaxID=980116 RepID=A0A8H6I1Y4_9AGAR|nr:hypothetical protein DFP72DRAFT_234029 [Tulosesus angulatus]